MVKISPEGKVKLDFKVESQADFVAAVLRENPASPELRREVPLVIVPVKTFSVEAPYVVSLRLSFLF
jgi:hypothetical protein